MKKTKKVIVILFVFSAISYSNSEITRTTRNDVPNNSKLNGLRIYGECPKGFIRNKHICYYFSNKTETWSDAHFDCRDMKAKLAEPLKSSERMLRKYLIMNDKNRSQKWIGGIYNWENMKWQWGHDSRDMNFQAFGQIDTKKSNLKYACTAVDPTLNYRWVPKLCTEKLHYICQKNVPYVNERNKHDLMKSLNGPARESNKLLYSVNDIERHYQPRKPQQMTHRKRSHNTAHQVPANLAAVNLTGSVDLGIPFKKPQRKIRKNRKGNASRTPAQRTTIPTTTPETITTARNPITELPRRTNNIDSKQINKQASGKIALLSPEERRRKAKRLKEKLARLTPQQRAEFIAMKRERALQRKNSLVPEN